MNVSRLCLKGRNILLRRGEMSDYDSVLKFLRKNFYPYDPFGSAGPYKQQSVEDEQMEMKALECGASVVMTTNDASRDLVGVAMGKRFSEKVTKENLHKLQGISLFRGSPNNLEGIIFLEELTLRAEVCRKFSVPEAFLLSTISTREDFRRYNLATILNKNLLDFGRELGLSVCFCITISHLASKFSENSQMEKIYSLKFSDYKDFRGIHVFRDYIDREIFSPDATADVWAKKL